MSFSGSFAGAAAVEAGSIVRWRWALVALASAGGNTVLAIARLAATSQDRVREMIHRFSELGWLRWTLSGRVAVPSGSQLTARSSSSRRRRRALRRWGWRSRVGVCSSLPRICAAAPSGRCG